MSGIDRRGALLGIGATALSAASASAMPGAGEARKQPRDSLASVARRAGLAFGSAFAWSAPGADRGSFANPAYARLLERECALLVPENEMKWQRLRPAPDAFDFARFDAMVRYARKHGFAVRGHTLLWHQTKWMPKWEATHDFGSRPASAAAALLTRHIDTVCARYGKSIYSYDVVNEAVNPDDSDLHQTALTRAIGGGSAAIDLAFHTARAAAPHAELAYNDYMSWAPGNAKHRAGVLRLLEGMRKRGVPVDVLGVQSHLITQGTDTGVAVSRLQTDWRRFLDDVTAMGYRLSITELDVRDNNLPADPAVRDRAVADFTRAYLDVMFDYPALKDVLAWGMTDRYSWIEGFEPRGDRARRRPCPYDDAFRAKPMRSAIAGALASVRRG
jgi:endo-1,4-beta-xylanase